MLGDTMSRADIEIVVHATDLATPALARLRWQMECLFNDPLTPLAYGIALAWILPNVTPESVADKVLAMATGAAPLKLYGLPDLDDPEELE